MHWSLKLKNVLHHCWSFFHVHVTYVYYIQGINFYYWLQVTGCHRVFVITGNDTEWLVQTAIKVLGKYQELLDFFTAIVTNLEIIMQNAYQYDNHSPENGKTASIWYAMHIKYNMDSGEYPTQHINDCHKSSENQWWYVYWFICHTYTKYWTKQNYVSLTPTWKTPVVTHLCPCNIYVHVLKTVVVLLSFIQSLCIRRQNEW